MIYGSVCAGIEAATVAWHPLGWEPAFFSEIEAFPRAVLQHHYPHVPLHGDFTTIEPGQYRAIDFLVGGTPCQDFSVAGLRAGIAGDRGALTIEFCHLAGRLRPEWLVWENVPGVLSADDGRAFGIFLGLLGQLGYGFAYRILDAQYFGAPQRRRRVFVVGRLGDWRAPAAVLFDSESLSGNPAPERDEWQTAHTLSANGFDASEDGSGRGRPIVIAFTAKDDGGDAGETAPTLRSLNHDKSHANSGKQVAIAFSGGNSKDAYGIALGVECTPPLRASSSGTNQRPTIVTGEGIVRYITPIEAERLQAFPDNYTLIPYRKRMAADGPRYHALGNSMNVLVMRWIGERIAMVEQIIAKETAA